MLADGQPVQGPGRHRLVMFQESALFPWLNVFGNVMFGLHRKPELTQSAAPRDRRISSPVGRPGKIQEGIRPRTVGRHEAARRAGAIVGARSARAADGRTAVRARRDYARATLLRHSGHLAAAAARRSSSSPTTCAKRSCLADRVFPAVAEPWTNPRRISHSAAAPARHQQP